MIIRFPKQDKNGKVIPNVFDTYETQKVSKEQSRMLIESNVTRVSHLNVIIDALQYSKDSLETVIKEQLVNCKEALLPEKNTEKETETTDK